MINVMNVEFGQGKKLSAVTEKFSINVDMPLNEGGEGSSPAPIDLFLASLATCAGHYARKFCEERAISMEGMGLKIKYKYDEEDTSHITKFSYQLTLPEGFPEKDKAALLRTLDLCPIRKHLMNPPAFGLEIV